jgi:energy-coupling factor transporter ATP-binding protein EcfA2
LEHARELNTSIAPVEVVLVGATGCGKSALLSALLGHQVAPVGAKATMRPLCVRMVASSKVAAGSVRATVKKSGSASADEEVSLDKLQKVIASRMGSSVSDEPLTVVLEAQHFINLTLWDTPGLDDSEPRREAIVADLIADGARRILACEVSQASSDSKIAETVKRFDADFTRTTFVATRFQRRLASFSSPKELGRHLSQAFADARAFHVTVPSSSIVSSDDDMRVRVYQAYRRDLASLEALEHDKKYESAIGVYELRRFLLESAWRHYQGAVPRVLRVLRVRTHEAERSLDTARSRLKELDAARLRSIASSYVVDFLQGVTQLVEGSSEANPSATGQTLAEEHRDSGVEEWLGANNRPLTAPSSDDVPFSEVKVYGGQQFERLLSEFRAVVSTTGSVKITDADVASSAGLNKQNNVPNYALAAADIAASKTNEAMVPLIDQLTERAVYVVKRVGELADMLVTQRARARTRHLNREEARFDIDSPSQYPYFTHHVRDLFNKFAEAAAKAARAKCMDEFYSARTVYWHMSEYSESVKALSVDRSKDDRAAIVALAQTVAEQLRERIVANVVLKFYNFFLVRVQSEGWVELQGRLAKMSDKSLEQLFHLPETQSRLRAQEKRAAAQVEKLVAQDKRLVSVIQTFAHPSQEDEDVEAGAPARVVSKAPPARKAPAAPADDDDYVLDAEDLSE